MRFRRLVIEPGGIVPWHSHDDRPAIIYVVEGEVVEYASELRRADRAQGRRNRAERHGTSHWWKNLQDTTAVLFVGDVRYDRDDHHM